MDMHTDWRGMWVEVPLSLAKKNRRGEVPAQAPYLRELGRGKGKIRREHV